MCVLKWSSYFIFTKLSSLEIKSKKKKDGPPGAGSSIKFLFLRREFSIRRGKKQLQPKRMYTSRRKRERDVIKVFREEWRVCVPFCLCCVRRNSATGSLIEFRQSSSCLCTTTGQTIGRERKKRGECFSHVDTPGTVWTPGAGHCRGCKIQSNSFSILFHLLLLLTCPFRIVLCTAAIRRRLFTKEWRRHRDAAKVI